MKNKQRNEYVDILRGLAILMVVLGHTITGNTTGWEHNFIFNVVWCLQMPLFMLISGYVTRYTKNINNRKLLYLYLKRRTVAYLMPWIVWTFLIRGIILNQKNYLNPRYIFLNMDSGYWFLFSIWTISVIFLISTYISNKLYTKQNKILKMFITGGIYILGMVFLMLVAVIFGTKFAAIKLTLYYMPFYFIGYMFGQLQEEINIKISKKQVELFVAICFLVTVFSLLRVDLYSVSDSGIGIIIRPTISLIGCIGFVGIVVQCCKISDSIGGDWHGAENIQWKYIYHITSF